MPLVTQWISPTNPTFCSRGGHQNFWAFQVQVNFPSLVLIFSYLDFPNTTNGWHQSRQCPLAAAAQASQNSLNCRNPIISCQLDHYFCSNNILHRLHSNIGEWNMKCDQFLFVLCCEWLVSFLVEIFATFVRAAGGDTSWFARPPLTILLRCTSWPELETGDITHLPNTEGAYDISR